MGYPHYNKSTGCKTIFKYYKLVENINKLDAWLSLT